MAIRNKAGLFRAAAHGFAFALSRAASIVFGAGVAVITWGFFTKRNVNASGFRIAGVFGAGVAVVAVGDFAFAFALVTAFPPRTFVVVVTGRTIGYRRVNTALLRVARVFGADFAVVAHDRGVSATGFRIATVGCASVLVITIGR